ncbi:MAG: CotH kinase family protein, partial [Verrucomicrobiales bacterium]
RNVEHERLIDIENVIDYMLITFYTGDKDGPGGTYGTGNNYFSIYNRENPDGFKFFEHDSEHSLGKGLVDMTGSFTEDDPGNRRTRNIGENQFNVHWLHTLLVGNSRYIAQFTKRAEEVFFEGGPLTPAVSLARLEAREKTIDQAIIAHSARWGDAASGSARTRETWLGGVQEIKEFIATRNDTLIRQLHGRGWYTGLPAPRFNRKDDLVGKGFKWFVVGGEGEIYVTTDGSDPRDAEGKPSATAKLARIPQIEHTTLLGSPVPARAWVPQDGLLGLGWIQPGFDDSMWIDGQTGIGYEGKSGYEDLIGIDLEDAMLDLTTTAYMRTHFQIADPSTHAYDELHLKMRYDDGFIAYLNGERIAAENAPPDPNWQSAASADHPDAEAEEFVAFPIDHAASLLREGDNVLAIHGMDGVRSSDFIITPEIEGLRYTGADPISLNPGQTTIRARSRKDDKWSPMVEALVEMK